MLILTLMKINLSEGDINDEYIQRTKTNSRN